MKRALVASILGLAASVATTYSQGVIIFDSYHNSFPNTYVAWDSTHPAGYNTGDAVTDTSLVIGLYAGAGTLTDSSLLTTLLGTTPIYDSPGLVYGGGWLAGPSVAIPTSIWSGSGTVSFQVRPMAGTGANGPLTWTDAIWQESGQIVSINLPAHNFANGPTQLIVSEVPEPGVFALAGLGAAALTIFRKRQ